MVTAHAVHASARRRRGRADEHRRVRGRIKLPRRPQEKPRERDRTAADIASSNQDAKELFYFDMVAAGIWIARRGFVALNIMIGDAEADRFVAAVDEFVQARKALLR